MRKHAEEIVRPLYKFPKRYGTPDYLTWQTRVIYDKCVTKSMIKSNNSSIAFIEVAFTPFSNTHLR